MKEDAHAYIFHVAISLLLNNIFSHSSVKPVRCVGIQLACLLIFLPVLIWHVLRTGKGPKP